MADCKQQLNNSTFSILSLFSGGGFLDIGFINQGFQIVEAVEIEPNFIKSYNFGMDNYFKYSKNAFVSQKLVKHITIQRPVDVSNESEQNNLTKKYAGISGLIGGPPCQDYSVGGKNAGIEGEKGRLIHSYLGLVKKVLPQFLFFENVEGLYKVKRHRKAFNAFVEELENCGYVVWHDILNVLNYGYAQDRPRIALVAFKKEIIERLVNAGYKLEKDNFLLKSNGTEKFVFKWPEPACKEPKMLKWPQKSKFGKDLELTVPVEQYRLCVENAFSGLRDNSPNQNEYFNPKSSRFSIIEEGDTNRKSFKRLHRLKYSPTVAYGNNEVHLHPTEARRLTVREALRLQTVPDEYVLPKEVSLTHKFKLISNGVPTAKAELVAKEIRRTLMIYNQLGGHLE
ncbi:MAG TPA: DNA cytosine methyltransferase [Mucilaginibacter sp.]